ncbi:MAG: hypothetical protein WAM82_22570 [Thermoanaerobaculia bacterium]
MRRNVLLLVPYLSNRSAKGVLSALKQQQPNVSVTVLNTSSKQESPRAPYAEGDCFWVGHESLGAVVRSIVAEREIDLIVPTKDPLVRFCVTELPELRAKFLLPARDVVLALQDKLATYQLFAGCSEVRIPEFHEASPANADRVKSMLARSGEGFQKPRIASSGAGVKRIARIEDVDWRSDSVVCQPLLMPEYNQTFLLRGGAIRGGVTYRSSRQICSPTDDVEKVSDLVEGRVAMRFLREAFGSDLEGVFNLDFMRNEDGWLILNEINPGRFPAGIHKLAGNFGDLVAELLWD